MYRKRKKRKNTSGKIALILLILVCAYISVGYIHTDKKEGKQEEAVAVHDETEYDAITEEPKEDMDFVDQGDVYSELVYVEYIDVGQGDCSLIYDWASDYSCLIDTGLYEAYDNVQATLSEYGIEELDALILTHPDTDHIQSAVDIIEDYNVSSVYMSRAVNYDAKSYEYLLKFLESYQGDVIYPNAGDIIFSCDSMKLSVIGPCSYDDLEDTNGHSLVVRLDNGEDSFLFLGDATGAEIEEIMSSGYDLEADVLKASHHGSANDGCNSKSLFDRAMPEYLIVSCAYGNEYGHPHIETMELAKEYGLKLFRTDLQGNVRCTSYASELTWSEEPTTVYTNGNGF